MEEQKKEKPETGKKKSIKDIADDMPGRSVVLWCLAGFYLIYTGYKLCSNVIKGVDGGGIGFLLAGIVFLVIGGVLLFYGLRARFMPKKGNAEPEEIETVEEIVQEEEPAEPRKMSISERAALASRIDQDTDEDTEE